MVTKDLKTRLQLELRNLEKSVVFPPHNMRQKRHLQIAPALDIVHVMLRMRLNLAVISSSKDRVPHTCIMACSLDLDLKHILHQNQQKLVTLSFMVNALLIDTAISKFGMAKIGCPIGYNAEEFLIELDMILTKQSRYIAFLKKQKRKQQKKKVRLRLIPSKSVQAKVVHLRLKELRK